jgi:hypothetical protein
MTNAAINATYVDYKRVKGRKVHQIIMEVPSEQWPEFYKVLGEPDIETSQWFAIAKMAVREKAPTPENNGVNLTANAAMMLGTSSFLKFLEHRLSVNLHNDELVDYDGLLKGALNIKSKRELNTDPAAASRWRDLRAEYENWMRG